MELRDGIDLGALPPEMALREDADARSDIYALGCVASWLLTGQTGFAGATTMEIVPRSPAGPRNPPRKLEFGRISTIFDSQE